jgi:hypothetical protein
MPGDTYPLHTTWPAYALKRLYCGGGSVASTSSAFAVPDASASVSKTATAGLCTRLTLALHGETVAWWLAGS